MSLIGWPIHVVGRLERSYFSMALMGEMIRRGVDVSSVVKWDDRSGRILSVRYVLVRYDEASKSLIPLS